MSRPPGHRSDPSTLDALAATARAPAAPEGISDQASPSLNLKQVARRLDVHYMTAYRYVRNGLLPARRQGPIWVVDLADLEDFRRDRPSTPSGRPVDWVERLRQRLLNGDEVGAWTVITDALSAGHSAQTCHLELLAPAAASVDADLAGGQRPVSDGLMATTTAARLVARLGGSFRHRGRSKGRVICGTPPGEHRGLVLAIVANLVRLDGFTVVELGTDVPPVAFIESAHGVDDLVVIVLGIFDSERLPATQDVIEAIHGVLPDLPVVVTGLAAKGASVRFAGSTTSAVGEAATVTEIRRLATLGRSSAPKSR